jgi:phosphoenolpyruvate synthase/pyruvate phosphate dikinase
MTVPSVKLESKARTLALLSGVVKKARILPLEYFTVEQWQKDSSGIVDAILIHDWAQKPLIVRSSGVAEDSTTESLAGYYDSILNVSGRDVLVEAIESVIKSFGEKPDEHDEVLVQPMLDSVQRSGVAFTADAVSVAPYYVIEWTDGEDTTAVTAGKNTRTFYSSKSENSSIPKEISGVYELLAELETLFPDQPLDVEFGISDDQVYLLQCRALVLKERVFSTEKHTDLLQKIANKAEHGFRPHPFLHGRRTIYGVMPDWNPAEIIGTRPRPLAFSLYRELITNSTWAYQRNNYGYKNLRSHPLLIDFMGQPYVDVRVSFNSFVPRDIDSELADRLVDHYLDRLEENPQFHDKVEFDIVFTCYTFDLEQRMKRLKEAGFSQTDCSTLLHSLRSLTNRIINAKSGLWVGDAERVKTLTERRDRLYRANTDSITKIYWLLEDCKRYGTLPFAGLARAGFVSVSLLKSLVSLGVLTKAESDRFINSLDAVSSQLPRDLNSLDQGEFLAKYGHLRPGTYDILSARYDKEPDLYFDWEQISKQADHTKPEFKLGLDQMKQIEKLLKEHAIDNDVIGLFEFLGKGIELRESSKFEFTRNLSDALELIAEVGEQYGFSREDMSFASIDAFYEMYRSSVDPKQILEQSILAGRDAYSKTCQVVLPPLMTSINDVWAFELPETEPNFITQQRVTAEVTTADKTVDLKGKIVCISSADPGFDWLFSHDIAGLITCYGGANSHMAIRANELGLPAIIGAGETKYALWSGSRRLDIDCANCKVEVIS